MTSKWKAYFLRSAHLTRLCIRSQGKKILDAEFSDIEISVATEEAEQIGFEEDVDGQRRCLAKEE
jgi:hypothetical protein